MNRFTLSSLLLIGLVGLGVAQPPMPLPASGQTPPKVDPPKTAPPKTTDKPNDPVTPVVPAVPPPVTLPALASSNLAAPALTAAGTSFSRSSQPNVYGNDLGITGRYSPYLIATLPNGQRQTILPGQQALLPVGTTFDRTVTSRVVTVTVPGTPNNPGAPDPDVPLPPQTTRQLLEVTGPNALAHSGGLPVNVVRGAFKIGENESPRPQDRVYVTYNFFSDVNGSLVVPGLERTTVHRETFGLEKTFLDGNASVGLRLPLIQIGGQANIQRQGMGDLSVILKYALINDWIERGDGTIVGGNVLSTGVVVTAPTGNSVTHSALHTEIHPTMIQPFVGGVLARENYFVQGFSSIAVPTDDRDTTFLFNSLQVGYYLYQDPTATRILRSVTPVIECHVNTPLNNRGLTRLPIGSIDTVSITGGTTLGLGRSAFLNLGCNVPLTGPKPYDLEAMAQLNWRF